MEMAWNRVYITNMAVKWTMMVASTCLMCTNMVTRDMKKMVAEGK